MTSLLRELLFDTEIEAALFGLDRRNLGDPEYYHRTVGLIEEGFSPTGLGRLTHAELEAWIERVTTHPPATPTTQPKEADRHAQPAPRIVAPQNRPLQDPQP